MKKKIVSIIVVLMLCVPFLAVPLHAEEEVRNYDFGFATGYSILEMSDPDMNEWLDGMAAIGAGYIRVDFNWAVIQAGGPNSWSWSFTDRVVDAAIAKGFKILPIATHIPSWAGTPSTIDPADYENFLYHLGLHYIPKGVVDWELWNEANIQGFTPADYTTRILIPGALGIRQAAAELNETVTVVSTGLAPAATNGTDTSMVDFVTGMYTSGGKDYFDALGVHPYTWPNDPKISTPYNFLLKTQELHDVMTLNGDGAKKLWATEVGFPTNAGPQGISEALQAEYIQDSYDIWQSFSYSGGPYLMYSFKDLGTDNSNPEHFFGIIRNDGTAKPSLAVVTDMIANIPPEPVSAVRVMPLGDSITDGYTDYEGGYRIALGNMYNEGEIQFVGSLENGPTDMKGGRQHEGHSGWFAKDNPFGWDLYSHIDDWLLAAEPDIVLLHAGTNDKAAGNQSDTVVVQRIEDVINKIAAYDPTIDVVVATLIPSHFDTSGINSGIRAMVADLATDGKQVYLSDQAEAGLVLGSANDYRLNDNTHPGLSGYAKMAAKWDEALRPLVAERLGETVLPPSGMVDALHVLSPVTVDGNLNESAWRVGTPIAKSLSGLPDNTAVYDVLWDNNYLYIGAKVFDGDLLNDSANIWEDDSLEVYVDADNSHSSTYDIYDRQFIQGYNDSNLFEIGSNISGVLHGWSSFAGGYSMEMAIPWSNLGITAADDITIGFDIAVNDDDDGGGRDSQFVWNGGIDNWATTETFGNIRLSPETIGSPSGPVDYYQIQSRWQPGQFLYDGGTTVNYGNGADDTYLWSFEVYNGYTRIKNKATGHYMHTANGPASVESTVISASEAASHWTITSSSLTSDAQSIQNALNQYYLNIEGQLGYAEGDLPHMPSDTAWHSAQWFLIPQ